MGSGIKRGVYGVRIRILQWSRSMRQRCRVSVGAGRVLGLLRRPERAVGLRGYLFPAGSEYVLGASCPILSGVGGGTLGRQVG